MVVKNTKNDLLCKEKKFAKGDTSYSSFWLYNRERDLNSQDFKDKFVNFYDEKELLSEFNTTVAKNIISFWSKENDIILDPFSGRTRALVSYAMNRQYIGYEVSKHVVDYMSDKFDSLKLKERNDFNVEIRNKDCIDIENDFENDSVDMVFSCPPYWNLEEYEDCNGQLSSIDDYNNFLDELQKRLDISVEALKPNRYMCLVVGDFRKKDWYVKFHSDLMNRMDANKKIRLYDVISVQNIPFNTAAFYFGNKRKLDFTSKAHEYLLVWKKIGEKKEYINSDELNIILDVNNKIIKEKKVVKERFVKMRIDFSKNFASLVESLGFKQLDPYIGTTEKVRLQCGEGHIWGVQPRSVKGRNRCPYCSKKVEYTIDDAHSEAFKYGFKCLDDVYINNQKSLKLECLKCSRRYRKVISQIKNCVCKCGK